MIGANLSNWKYIVGIYNRTIHALASEGREQTLRHAKNCASMSREKSGSTAAFLFLILSLLPDKTC